MLAVADTTGLVADGVLTPDQAAEIEARARGTMVDLAVAMLLTFGILAATGGLIFWLKDAASVAASGLVFIGLGAAVLTRAPGLYRMFGSAAVLIGAGMLTGGAGVELTTNYPDAAGWVMVPLGGAIALAAGFGLKRTKQYGFIAGAVLLMGVAMHLCGGGWILDRAEITGPSLSLFW